jgi:hypothetical protein
MYMLWRPSLRISNAYRRSWHYTRAWVNVEGMSGLAERCLWFRTVMSN